MLNNYTIYRWLKSTKLQGKQWSGKYDKEKDYKSVDKWKVKNVIQQWFRLPSKNA